MTLLIYLTLVRILLELQGNQSAFWGYVILGGIIWLLHIIYHMDSK